MIKWTPVVVVDDGGQCSRVDSDTTGHMLSFVTERHHRRFWEDKTDQTIELWTNGESGSMKFIVWMRHAGHEKVNSTQAHQENSNSCMTGSQTIPHC